VKGVLGLGAFVLTIAEVITAGAIAQQDQPALAQYQAELTKTARERDAGADYVAALLTQLADTRAQAVAADQQIAADGARIGNLVKENAALTKERDELKAKVGTPVIIEPNNSRPSSTTAPPAVMVPSSPPSATILPQGGAPMPTSAPPGPAGPAAGGSPP
jgi:hypothetical protein